MSSGNCLSQLVRIGSMVEKDCSKTFTTPSQVHLYYAPLPGERSPCGTVRSTSSTPVFEDADCQAEMQQLKEDWPAVTSGVLGKTTM